MSLLVFGNSPVVRLNTPDGTLEYDVRKGGFRDKLSEWKNRYNAEFPKNYSFSKFYQLFKQYL